MGGFRKAVKCNRKNVGQPGCAGAAAVRSAQFGHLRARHHPGSVVIALTLPKDLDGVQNMKLYVTYSSPYARLARIIVIQKALEDRVEIIEAKTRTPAAPTIRSIPPAACPIWSMIPTLAWKTASSSAPISTA